ncbi:MAG: zinc-ribbon domain-containing protein [Candidatus Thorarchaeota archaeon]
MSAKKFCSNCGNPLKETSVFCAECGTRIDSNANPSNTPQTPISQSANNPDPNMIYGNNPVALPTYVDTSTPATPQPTNNIAIIAIIIAVLGGVLIVFSSEALYGWLGLGVCAAGIIVGIVSYFASKHKKELGIVAAIINLIPIFVWLSIYFDWG